MVKRTADVSAAGHSAHRAKRRRDTASDSSAEDYGSESEAGDNDNDESYGGARSDPTREAVKQTGLNILRILAVAKSKDGRLLAALFHEKPPKQQYPDYYNFTKHPIALNDIKKKLLSAKYNSHEDAKADFDLCFNNAKAYNMEGSDIYADAAMMQQIVSKEYDKLAPAPGPNEMQVDTEENLPHDDSKKIKEHSLHSLLKSRLKQLLERTEDDTGRILSGMFQELPSKKAWASYYETIKQPIAFDIIKKRVKKKDYSSSAAFASDVELVFSNAMTFNSEGSQIYADAVTLRDLFRQLMSDLPSPHTLSQYQKSTAKIKLKLPATKPAPTAASAPVAPPAETKLASPVVVNKVEEVPTDIPSAPAPPPPRPPSPKLPSTLSIQPRKANAIQPAASTSKLQQPTTPVQPPRTRAAEAAAAGTIAQPSSQQPVYAHAPSLRSLAAITATMSPAPVTPKAIKTPLPPPPPPAPHYHYLLKQAHLETQPRGRLVPLSSSVGVTNWVIQLGDDEQNIVLSDIDFVANEDEEESSEEEERDDDDDADAPVTNGKKKGPKAKRGRGRPPKAAAKQVSKPKASPTKKKLRKLGDVQVKLDGQLISELKGDWNLPISGAAHVIELGEKEGMTWKIHVYRLP